MNSITFFTPARLSSVILGLSLMLSVSLSAAQYEEDVSTQEYLFIQGLVHSISVQAQSVTVQQKNGPEVTIVMDPKTEFEGVRKLEELHARQAVKIWYRPEPDGNRGLKVVKPPDIGC